MFPFWPSVFTWCRTFHGLHFYPCDIFTIYSLVADDGHYSCLWSPGECPLKNGQSFLAEVLVFNDVYKIFIIFLVIRRKNTSCKVHSSLDSAGVLYYPDSTNSPAKTRR